MVNIPKRELGARLLERFLSGEATNDDFIEGFPQDPDDPVLRAVEDIAWFCYDDDRTHTLRGNREPSPEFKRLLESAVLFLRTELEYEWPPYRFMSLKTALLKMLGMRSEVERRFEEFKRAGDWDVWPFLRRSDYAKGGGWPTQRLGKKV